jgi:hypothetical protein
MELHRATGFYVVGGLAVAAFGVSAVTGWMAWSAHKDVQQKCDSSRNYCSDPTGVDDASREHTLAWTSTAALGAGALAALLALAIPLEERPASAATLDVGPGRAGVVWRRDW